MITGLIWVFRHGPKETGPAKSGGFAPTVLLSRKGRRLIERLAKQKVFENQDFRLVLTSPLVRAHQTAVIFCEEWKRDFPEIDPRLFTPNPEKWEEVSAKCSNSNPTCVDFFNANPDLVASEGNRLFKVIYDIVKHRLLDTEDAFCISHGGLIEPAVAAAKVTLDKRIFADHLATFKDLSEGSGVIFRFDENNDFVGLEEIRFP